jgi:hypothetical protein
MTDHQLAQRAALCHEDVTLNGQPATIAGCRNPYATVAQLPSGLALEWSWETVARIVAAGGDFRA